MCACAPLVPGEVWGGGSLFHLNFGKEIATLSLFLFRIWDLKLFLTSPKRIHLSNIIIVENEEM